ncbi:hypothetical protein AB0436_29375 [Streptomyces sp. NPDC051322]|uniref:hypothetical protein n=1 Tax=Streptomyces sp. NPDC051322 TaxID=3154645 RepID=UPI00344C8E49
MLVQEGVDLHGKALEDNAEFRSDAVALWRAAARRRTFKDVAADQNVNPETWPAAGPGRQRRGPVHHVLARSSQLLGKGSAQAAGAFDGEAAVGPLLAPAHELAERARVDNEPALAHLVVCPVDAKDVLRKALSVGADKAIRVEDNELQGINSSTCRCRGGLGSPSFGKGFLPP